MALVTIVLERAWAALKCDQLPVVSAVFMAVLISLVFIKLILVIVKVNNSHKINKTLSCLAKTQPQPFLYNGILMILCVNMPIFCAYSIIRHALHLFCFMAKHAIVRFLIAFFALIDMWELLFPAQTSSCQFPEYRILYRKWKTFRGKLELFSAPF